MRCGAVCSMSPDALFLGLYDDGVKAKSVVRVVVIIGGGFRWWERLKTAP